MTILSITDRAEIRQGTFYNYFKSRDELVDTVIFELWSRSADGWTR